jgi:hypothetical protein
MWERGASLATITRALGYRSTINQSAMGVLDPQSAIRDPVPPRVPPSQWRAGEADEARVWRRFPITSHKPGYR